MTSFSSPSSSSASDAVTVARTVADTLVELAWTTRPGQSLSQADRYAVTAAPAAGLGALPQVLTQLAPPAAYARPQTPQTCREAVTTAHDLAALVDTAAQQLA